MPSTTWLGPTGPSTPSRSRRRCATACRRDRRRRRGMRRRGGAVADGLRVQRDARALGSAGGSASATAPAISPSRDRVPRRETSEAPGRGYAPSRRGRGLRWPAPSRHQPVEPGPARHRKRTRADLRHPGSGRGRRPLCRSRCDAFVPQAPAPLFRCWYAERKRLVQASRSGRPGPHPDFGVLARGRRPYCIPFITVAALASPWVPVTFDYDDESDPGPYPTPAQRADRGRPGEQRGPPHPGRGPRDNCVLYEL